MGDFHDLEVMPISRKQAKSIILKNHYMRTFPQGAQLCFGFVDKGVPVGVCVFGYSSATEAKVKRLGLELKREQYLELQRLWISDKYGHNTESYVLGQMVRQIKLHTDVQVIVTHAGGCKKDCGIVYQACSWLYFGKEKCNDFYLTDAGEYKNIIAAMRFGRVNSKGKSTQQIGEELFGSGRIINSFRYNYACPVSKRIRRQLAFIAKPYPKDSAVFRRNQEWQDG